VQKLQDQVGKVHGDPLFQPTKLFPTRKAVDQINLSKYAALSDPEFTFSLSRVNPMNILQTDTNLNIFNAIPETVKEYEYQFLATNLLVDPELRLKIGTQVMCVCNLSMDDPLSTVVNGSLGLVTGFSPGQNLPIVQFKNGVLKVMEYHTWLSDSVKGVAVAHIPLIYAWAVTIHKSQGASLDLAEIDAGSNIFECGQTYVALSRVKSLEGLYLTAFDPSKIKVNVKVQEFYGSLV
jgi:ATP-dependent DNA helicase PIF1